MKITIISLLVAMTIMTGCGPQYVQPVVVAPVQPMQQQMQPGYEMLYGANGQQMALVHDPRGDFYMDYILFHSLLGSGGYGSVWGRYQSNPSAYYNTTIVNNYSSYRRGGAYTVSGKTATAAPAGYYQNAANRPANVTKSSGISSNLRGQNQPTTTQPAQTSRGGFGGSSPRTSAPTTQPSSFGATSRSSARTHGGFTPRRR